MPFKALPVQIKRFNRVRKWLRGALITCLNKLIFFFISSFKRVHYIYYMIKVIISSRSFSCRSNFLENLCAQLTGCSLDSMANVLYLFRIYSLIGRKKIPSTQWRECTQGQLLCDISKRYGRPNCWNVTRNEEENIWPPPTKPQTYPTRT